MLLRRFPVKADLSIVHLVVNASLVVQIIMGLLLLVSLISWTRIFQKARIIKKASRDADNFEDRFWSGGDLAVLYNKVSGRQYARTGMEVIFEAGFREFARRRQQPGVDPKALMEGAERSMRIALSREIDRLEMSLPFLATVGSTSPYVGLFGTVWGIMNSFRALGSVKQATLGMVAPGISEALIATAMGLFAAIPAVIFYNRYSSDIERLINRYQTFLEEFSNILQRQAHK
jgi:biopolymer transport protein TolQ